MQSTCTTLTTNWFNFWRRMKTILPKELNDMKTLSVHELSVFQVKYSVSKLLLWLVCMQFPIEDQYTYMSRENKQQKHLWYRIFHLEDTECEWSHQNVKDVASCHETFQCSKCVQAFHYFSLLPQHYGVLWYEQMSFVKCTDTDETKGI